MAGFQQMKGNLAAIVGNKTNGLATRALGGQQLNRYFVGYGCWCNFDDQFYNMPSKGRGQPLDFWDSSCKMLADGYACMMIDGEADGEPCEEPWNQDYNIVGSGTDPAIITFVCAAITATKCQERACIVESFFVNRVGNTVISGAQFGITDVTDINTSYMHANNFDHSQCAQHNTGGPGSGQDKTISCCGKYGALAGETERKPFNVAVHDCCINGSTAPAGTC